MTYFGNTRSKVAGAFLPVTSYFYVWFTNQVNVFDESYIFFKKRLILSISKIYQFENQKCLFLQNLGNLAISLPR